MKICPTCFDKDKKINGGNCDCYIQKELADLFKKNNIPHHFWRFSFFEAMKIVPDYLVNKSDEKYLLDYYINLGENIISRNGLFLTGGYRSGKSSISYCLIKEALKQKFKVACVSYFKLAKTFGGYDEETKLMNKLINQADILIVDDVGRTTVGKQDFLGKINDELLRNINACLIMNSNLPVNSLTAKYGDSMEYLIKNLKTIKFMEGDLEELFNSETKKVKSITF